MSHVGIGCGRVGSLSNPVPIRVIEQTLREAAARGVTLFDTANIYGQGDSERLLGKLFGGRADIAIVTKGGRAFSAKARFVARAKPLLRLALLLRSRLWPRTTGETDAPVRVEIAAARAQQMHQDFSPTALRRSLEASLKRLRRTSVEGYLLHDPTPAQIADEYIIATLNDLREEGKVRRIGASINTATDLAAVAAAGCYDIVQLPLALLESELKTSHYRALVERGTIVHVRQVLQHAAAQGALDPEAAIHKALALPGVAGLIIGVSRPTHLAELLASAD